MFINNPDFLKEKIKLDNVFKNKLSKIKEHYLEFHDKDIENDDLRENLWDAGEQSFKFAIYCNIYILWFYSLVGKINNQYHIYYDVDINEHDKIPIKDFKSFVIYNFGVVAKLSGKAGILRDGTQSPWVLNTVDGEYLRERNRYLDSISLLFHNLIYNNLKLDSYDSVWVGVNRLFETKAPTGVYIESLQKILMGTVELTSESDKVLFNQGIKDFEDWFSGKDITAPSRIQNLIDLKIPSTRNFKSSMIDNYANLKIVKDYERENTGCLSIFLPIVFLFQFFR